MTVAQAVSRTVASPPRPRHDLVTAAALAIRQALGYARPNAGDEAVYKVKATDHAGRTVTFACGTPDQALEKVQDLLGRGFKEVSVADPKGKEWAASAFERFVND